MPFCLGFLGKSKYSTFHFGALRKLNYDRKNGSAMKLLMSTKEKVPSLRKGQEGHTHTGRI